MIRTTVDFLKKFIDECNPKMGDVLEVGSLDVNGNVRDIFKEFESYTGIDMRPGKNVDIVCNGHNLVKKFGRKSFDIVCCFDTLEHDERFWITVDQMKKVLRRKGWLLIGTPSLNHPRHDHPHDYYRFFNSAYEIFFEKMKNLYIVEQLYGANGNESKPDQVFGWAQK